MMIIENPQVYQTLVTAGARMALENSGIQRQTGNLINSIEVEVIQEDEDNTAYRLSFNDYGLYLDEGVDGASPEGRGKTAGGAQGLQFRFSGRFKMIGDPSGRLDWGARVNIYKLGIKPRPWIYNAITNIVDSMTIAIENDLAPEIETLIVEAVKANTGKITFEI